MLLDSIRHIEIVQALAEHRHFGRAATSLGISQPALSRALATLEEQIGAPLFERSTMLPATFGKVVLQRSARVLAEFAEINREINLLREMDIGEISIAMGPYPAAISGNKAAALLSRQRPNLKIELRILNWIEAIEMTADGLVDIAFADVSEAISNPNLVVRPVRKQSMSFICRAGHPLTKRPTLSIGELLEYPWIGPTIPGAIGRALPVVAEKPFGEFETAHQRFRPRIVAETFSAIKEVTMFSDGVSAAFSFQITNEVAANVLTVLPVDAPFLTLNYGLITKHGRTPTPAMEYFMKLVMETEAGLPPA